MRNVINHAHAHNEIDKVLVERAMHECDGSTQKAALYLGLTESALGSILRRLGWDRRTNWEQQKTVFEHV